MGNVPDLAVEIGLLIGSYVSEWLLVEIRQLCVSIGLQIFRYMLS